VLAAAGIGLSPAFALTKRLVAVDSQAVGGLGEDHQLPKALAREIAESGASLPLKVAAEVVGQSLAVEREYIHVGGDAVEGVAIGATVLVLVHVDLGLPFAVLVNRLIKAQDRWRIRTVLGPRILGAEYARVAFVPVGVTMSPLRSLVKESARLHRSVLVVAHRVKAGLAPGVALLPRVHSPHLTEKTVLITPQRVAVAAVEGASELLEL